MLRIDEHEYGKRDPRYDVVCPFCHAAIGSPCYVKKLDGSDRVTWIHAERKHNGITQAES